MYFLSRLDEFCKLFCETWNWLFRWIVMHGYFFLIRLTGEFVKQPKREKSWSQLNSCIWYYGCLGIDTVAVNAQNGHAYMPLTHWSTALMQSCGSTYTDIQRVCFPFGRSAPAFRLQTLYSARTRCHLRAMNNLFNWEAAYFTNVMHSMTLNLSREWLWLLLFCIVPNVYWASQAIMQKRCSRTCGGKNWYCFAENSFRTPQSRVLWKP